LAYFGHALKTLYQNTTRKKDCAAISSSSMTLIVPALGVAMPRDYLVVGSRC
jgi:hypothetical protein